MPHESASRWSWQALGGLAVSLALSAAVQAGTLRGTVRW